MMDKIDLFDGLGMNKLFAGGAFEYYMRSLTIADENALNKTLDEICSKENLIPLEGKWRRLNFLECSNLLLNAFRYDLAYMSSERMPEEKAQYFQEQILDRVNKDKCVCYTNWFNNPWQDKNGSSWNSITEYTFDLAVVIIDEKKVVFTYFIGED